MYAFLISFPQTSTPAQLTDSNARTTAASLCDGCVMATMTAAMMKMNPTPPALVHTKLEYLVVYKVWSKVEKVEVMKLLEDKQIASKADKLESELIQCGVVQPMPAGFYK